ncbi:hypothetical protein [Streptomyces sp. NPDC020489]|uniref:hypothetical protein n=1 Tax=Streptomyces sp. NPDC020489 TaxID=3365077 RepID=UPI003788F3AF
MPATAARALTKVHARVSELARQIGTGSAGVSVLCRVTDALLGPAGGEREGD